MGAETPKPLTARDIQLNTNADDIIKRSLEGDGPLGDYFDGYASKTNASLTKAKIREKKSKDPTFDGVLTKEELAEIAAKTHEQKLAFAQGDGKKPSQIKEALIASAKGESSGMQSLIENFQMVGQLGEAQNAFANFSILNPFGLINALIKLVTENDLVKAAMKTWFSEKTADSPKNFSEALAQVRAEKRTAELAKLTGSDEQHARADGARILAEMNKPVEPPANDNAAAASAAADDGGKFSAKNGELPPPPTPTPAGNSALASVTKGPSK